MLQFLKTKTFRITAIVVVILALYALGGFVVAPRLVRSALMKDVPTAIDATPAVGAIHINPFLFQVTVDDFALTGIDGEKLLGFKRLFIDFELSSLWHRAYSFANIDIDSPTVSAVMAKSGVLNLIQLRPKAAPDATPAKKSSDGVPAVRIGSFKVSQGLVTYEDRSKADVFAARLEPINFELREFTTGVAGGKFTFTGASKQGERVEWHGHLSVDPIESDGEFRIDGLLAHTLWEYLQDQVNFVIPSGTIDLAATYKFSLKNSGDDNLQLAISNVGIKDLQVRPKDSESDWVTVPSLLVTGTTVDLAQRQAHVDLVAVTGVKLLTWFDADGKLNLSSLGSSAPGAAATAPAAPILTANTGAPAPPAAPWRYDVRRIEVRDADISVEDRAVHPAVKVLLTPFSLTLEGASQDMAKPVKVTLDTHINESGVLGVSGDIAPQPAIANLDVKLTDIDLTAVQPFISQHTAMTLLSGKFGLDGKVHYGPQPKLPNLQFAGNLNVEKLHTVDDALRDDFINWDRLDVLGITYGQGPDRLDIEQIIAKKLYARVIIESDSSINVKRILRIPTPPMAPAGQQQNVANVNAGAPPPAAAQAMPLAINKIVLQASQANFADLSVKPNFATGIQKLEGTVTGMSSNPKSRAKVALKGAIDTFSPVSITGEVNVLGPLYTDLTMSFSNISLPVFDPYSGKFAGYNIAKGKLTTELHYKVDGRKLDAQHHIVVEQLEFGDKTASKEAVSLPIKLAVSLLKDRNGVIDLNIPVTGSLDDPQFRLAPIIWKVFVNILERAVTAPFALLGSMFGGGPDLQFIDFQPGVGTLDAAGLDKAKTVAKALVERPQLKIDVPIAVVPALDGPALAKGVFDSQVNSEQGAKGSPKKAAAAPGVAPPAYAQLDPATQLELLTRVYAKDVGSEPKFPDAVTSVKAKPDLVAAKLDFLHQAILDHIVVSDDDLQKLGQQRAAALQQALLADSQVEAERVFLVANDKAAEKDGAVRLELSLK